MHAVGGSVEVAVAVERDMAAVVGDHRLGPIGTSGPPGRDSLQRFRVRVVHENVESARGVARHVVGVGRAEGHEPTVTRDRDVVLTGYGSGVPKPGVGHLPGVGLAVVEDDVFVAVELACGERHMAAVVGDSDILGNVVEKHHPVGHTLRGAGHPVEDEQPACCRS